jgi:hypothetical protein
MPFTVINGARRRRSPNPAQRKSGSPEDGTLSATCLPCAACDTGPKRGSDERPAERRLPVRRRSKKTGADVNYYVFLTP